MTRELSELLGRRADLAIKPALKQLLRSGVLAEARLVYAAWCRAVNLCHQQSLTTTRESNDTIRIDAEL